MEDEDVISSNADDDDGGTDVDAAEEVDVQQVIVSDCSQRDAHGHVNHREEGQEEALEVEDHVREAGEEDQAYEDEILVHFLRLLLESVLHTARDYLKVVGLEVQ
jgi:hypothetical protein